ncbi:MAG: hypothetical protein RLZZ15_1937 [Verrucomicrobiota bacterium]|jgi:hypothetical protein
MKKILVTFLLSLFAVLGASAQSITITPSTTAFATTGGSVIFTVNISNLPVGYTALGVSVGSVPSGWTFGSVGGANVPETSPAAGTASSLSFFYTTPPATLAPTFAFSLNYPAGLAASQTVGSILLAFTPPASTQQLVAGANVVITPPTALPAITTAPTSVVVNQGQPATFAVVATGTPAPTYQWRFNLNPISGATNATYTLLSAQPTDVGNYDVVITNSVGAINSTAVSLTVNVPPVITQQPVGVTLNQGQAATFAVAATSTPAPTYQWRKNTNNIAGATNATFAITSVVFGDAGSFDVVVTNPAGSVTSTAAVLSVNIPPLINSAPASATIQLGGNTTFSASALGTAPFTFQWRKNGVAIPGATNTTLSITNATALDAATYDAVISNIVGSATSPLAVLTVLAPPTIVTQPASLTTNLGAQAVFTVRATGTDTLTYQWRRNSVNISTATTPTLTLSSVTLLDATTYDVVITNAVGTVTSATASLVVLQGATIATQPVAQSVTLGNTATFSVTASGTAPFAYQWRKGGAAISGATFATFSIPSVGLNDAGSYDVTVTNGAAIATSTAAALTVNFLPVITAQPGNALATQGLSASFTVAASGTPTPTYQWRKGGAPVSGATTATYSIASVVAADAGFYDVVVSNSVGSVISTTGQLVVNSGPTIVSSPGNFTAIAGQTASFAVAVTGTGPFSYQWRKDTNAIAGNASAFTSTLVLTNAQAADVGAYSVVVTNGYGTQTSTSGALTVSAATFGATVASNPPSTITVDEGNSAVFSIVATGNPAPTYQWRKGGVNLTDGGTITGSLTATLTVTSTVVADGGSYDCVVTNGGGSAASSPSVLTVNKLPLFTTLPTGATVNAGGTVTFTAAVVGSPTPTLQWLRDGSVVAGATNDTLTINPVSAASAGSYTLVASNRLGRATSSAAALVVNFAPTIAGQPAPSISVAANQSFTLSVTASGNPAPTYQWRKDTTPITGATNASIVISVAQAGDSGSYDCVIANSVNTVTSAASVVAVLTAPQVASSSGSITLNQGQTTTLTVTATGSNPLNYQWQKNGTNIPGATSAAYVIPSAVADSAGSYVAVVSNTVGTAASTPALVAVNTAPQITTSPDSQFVIVGSAASFNVVATGTPALTYQWSRNGANIDGAVFAQLSLANVQKTDAGLYRVAVSNAYGTVLTAVAALGVNDPTPVAPAFTTQPVGFTDIIGTARTLTAAATGTPAPTYQWRKDTTALTGQTNATLALTGVASENGSYTVVASNSAGVVTSAAAVVLFKAAVAAPVIAVQPASRSLAPGATAVLGVTATGQGPLTYQWSRGTTAVAGATTAELVLLNVTSATAGVYTVTITNEGGSVTSAGATVTVSASNAAPAILLQPAPQVALAGSTATFSVIATGTPAPTYKWRKNTNDIPGATNSSLTLTNVQTADAAGYDVVILNTSGQVISSLARLTIATAATAPVIIRQPADTRVIAGRSTSFTVAATGTPTPAYQWRFNTTAITGATNATLVLDGVATTQAGTYSVVVSNTAGSVTSANASLSVSARSYAGAYFGTLTPSGTFALRINEDNTGVFLAFVPGSRTAYVARSFSVDDNGVVRFVATTTTGAAAAALTATTGDDGRETAAAVDDLAYTIFINEPGGLIAGGTAGLAVGVTGARANPAGASAPFVGFYAATAAGSSAQLLVIVGPAGQAFALTQVGAVIDGGTGVVDTNGRVTITTSGSQNIVANIVAETGAVSAAVTDSKNVVTNYGGYAPGSSALGNQRLVNISTRTSAGIADQAAIVGFVVTGVESKTVLIRAVGPTLSGFGVTGFLAAPRLDLVRGSTTLATNVGWTTAGNTAEIAAAASRSGAFPLGATSVDSVILTTLAPGSYSAVCSAADARAGVALVEVYDLSGGSTAQKLANISTRANVGTGANIIIAGLVITGDVPKRVLIRAAGPALTGFGVAGALARPQLTLFAGNTTLATNSGWSTVSDVAAVTEAFTRAGAFAFANGSADAALLLNLAPGAYTAQVQGVGATTGISLVEIYELP